VLALVFLIFGQVDTGYASAYAEGVMEDVVRTRLENDWWPVPLPVGWYTVEGYVAIEDCRRVGEVTTLHVHGESYRVLVADCGERGKPGEGQMWMRENDVVVELDWDLWRELTGRYPKPLPVSLSG
jgi:hypothetical protein